jgi:hypothetical protein
VPPPPVPPPPRRHFRVFCIVWGWGRAHMWGHKFVRVRVCFRLRFLPLPVHFPRPLPPRGLALGHFGHHGRGFGDGPRGRWGDRH